MPSHTFSVSFVFLSTPSARRATRRGNGFCCAHQDFYPRPPRGGRLLCVNARYYKSKISIHALREEGDRHTMKHLVIHDDISIHALREEGDPRSADIMRECHISIHALREEGDGRNLPRRQQLGYFYPRPPRGGRRLPCTGIGKMISFLSTPSARRATEGSRVNDPCGVFLSTPSARRATLLSLELETDELIFLSTPSARRATDAIPPDDFAVIFLSTPSARRATAKTERKPSAFVSLYTSLHKLQRGACKTNRKITPLLVQTAGIPVRSVRENHVRCLFALAGHQKISTLSCANSGCSPTCSTLVW